MTLSNEQIIQVAEKVWGYESKFDAVNAIATIEQLNRITRLPVNHEIRNRLELRVIADEVESWAGFGRTVEAMAERKLSGDSLQELSVIYEGYLSGNITCEQLWNTTHLAALEADEWYG